MKRRRTMLTAILSMALLVTGCGGGGNSSKPADNSNNTASTVAAEDVADSDKYGGNLVTASNLPLNNLYGLVRQGNTYNWVFPAVEKLAILEMDGSLRPLLAESWERDDENMTFTVHLRPGIKFSDGSDLTADVLKWNLETMVEHGLGSNLQNPKTFEVIDENTLKIGFDEFSLSWETSILNVMVYSQLEYETYGEDYCMNHPVGTGPFVLKEYQTDTYLYYEKNPNYWQEGLPYLDSYKILCLKDASTTQTAFINGEIQFFKAFTPEQVSFLSSQGIEASLSRGAASWAYQWVGPTSTVEGDPFYDAKVRQAVFLYGIDWDAVANVCGGPQAESTVQINSEGCVGFDQSIEDASYYDLEKAKAMLAEAGYPNGFNTKIILPSGAYNQLGTILQAQLLNLGINAEVEINADYARIKEEGKTPGINVQDSPGSLDRTDYVLRTWVDGARGAGYINFTDEYNEIVQKVKDAKTLEEREENLKELYKSFHIDNCYLRGAFKIPQRFYISDKLHDSGLDETLYTPEITWLSK